MAQRALGAGMIVPRKRALFGLLDADGWAWAERQGLRLARSSSSCCSGYIPDRAYYLTVNRTVDLGVLAWSPINLCPPDQRDPAVPGAGRGDHAVARVAGRAGPARRRGPMAPPRSSGPRSCTSAARTARRRSRPSSSRRLPAIGNFDKWAEGPPLPEPRSDASVVQVSGTVYVLGGLDADGAPTTTVFTLTPDPQTGELPDWETAPEALTLPEARAGAAGVAAPDGHAAHRRRGPGWTGRDDLEEPVQRPGRPAEVGDRGPAPGSAGRRDRRDHRRPRVAVRRA